MYPHTIAEQSYKILLTFTNNYILNHYSYEICGSNTRFAKNYRKVTQFLLLPLPRKDE